MAHAPRAILALPEVNVTHAKMENTANIATLLAHRFVTMGYVAETTVVARMGVFHRTTVDHSVKTA